MQRKPLIALAIWIAVVLWVNSRIVLTYGGQMAELKKIVLRGYAVSLGERTPGIGSVSAPVFDYRQRILASLSLAVPEIRTRDKTHFSRCITLLMDAAQAFSKAMGQSVTHHNPIPQHV